MLKTLKTQSRKKILRNSAIKNFIKHQLWQYLLIIAFCCLYGWLFDKWAQVTMFVIAHTVIRPRFDKQYHCKTTFLCICLTLTILLFATYLVLPMEISLLSTLPVTYLICWVGYLAQIKVDFIKYKKKNAERTIYSMTEDELRNYAQEKGLPEIMIDTLVLKVMHNYKWVEIQQERNYSKTAIKYHKKVIQNKLNIKF